MKKITSKIISLVCVLCITVMAYPAALAADNMPQISVSLANNERSASITLKNAGMSVYSAQLALKISPDNVRVSVEGRNAYGTVKQEDDDTILYIDSTDLLDGSKDIKLASLSSDTAMSIGNTASLTLLDRSMRPVVFDSVEVNVTKASDTQPPAGGGGGGSNSGSRPTGGGTSIVGGMNTGNTGTTVSAFGKFTDVPDSHWARNSIAFVTGAGLFEGTSETTFEPSTNMTRAMYVLVLSRFGAKIDPRWTIPCDTPMKFNDVPEGEWYSYAVSWAGGTGLVNGVGEGIFAPDMSVTREQIAVMTVNFAKLCGAQLPENEAEEKFADESSISYWASDAVHAAQRAGLINGRDGNVFDPQATATRAEVATILHRFVEKIK